MADFQQLLMNLAYLALMYKDNPILTRQNHRATCTSLNCTRSRWSQDHDTLLRPTVQSTLDLKEKNSIFLGFCNVAVLHWWRPNPNLAWSFSFGFKRDELHQEAPYGRAFVRGNIGSVWQSFLHEVDQETSWDEHHVFVFQIPLVPLLTLRLGSILLWQKGRERHHWNLDRKV